MNRAFTQPAIDPDASLALEEGLRGRIQGEVRFDALSRTLYATDASIYEVVPLGVVLPKNVNDVVAVVEECRKSGTTIIPRGAGTGLTGGAVGPGVQLDLSRYMNHIGDLDLDTRTVSVEPGVVLDELNAHLAPHGLQFAPDVATGSRATIGGMIANNACGAHSIVYGRTVDHVLELTVVLADGEVVTFGDPTVRAETNNARPKTRVAQIERDLSVIRDDCYDEIQRRFPKILRSNGGYGLDRLEGPGHRADVIKILCGSEGTLGIVVRAKLRLIPVPRHTGLVVLHFEHLLDALGATPTILLTQPAAVELVDQMIIEAGRANLAVRERCDFLEGDPSALLIVEFHGNDAAALSSRIEALVADTEKIGSCYAASKVVEPHRQTDVWNLRKAGLGLLMSKPGDAQPYAFVEDSAVDPSRLRDYIERFAAILRHEGVEAGYYAHASVGCIHVRPVVNLKKADDVERMRRIAEAVSDLALEFSGAMTGEHGDGIVRSCWIEKMYGPRIVSAFKKVKRLFDPENLFNPHKIVDPKPMTDHLRYGPSFRVQPVKTYLDFSAHGGMAGLAGMCSGVGQCRQRLVGTMCPSYMATNDEKHTTRARANALRVALSNRGLLEGLDDSHLAEVMDLCIGCKACKTECPAGVDMARLKAEYLSHRNLVNGVSPRARLIADLPHKLAMMSRVPGLSNWLSQSRLVRAVIERRYGLDRRVPPPKLAPRTFRAWFRRHHKQVPHPFQGWGMENSTDPRSNTDQSPTSGRDGASTSRGSVVYFVDTWTNYFAPQVGIAAVTLLERAGFTVHCPRTFCCGRPAISQGLLADAKQLAEFNVRRLARFTSASVPIVGTEPSCILTLVDEYPQLVRSHAADGVAEQSMMIETFLRRLLNNDPTALTFRESASDRPLLYHAHCHQKAIVGSTDAVSLLRHVWGDAASEIDSGCCGMAGSFGHEVEHYDVARAIGEQRLFPAVRGCPIPSRGGGLSGEALIAISGFSCRQQIEHHTGVRARHVVECLADALA